MSDIARVRFGSNEAKYGRFCFHTDERVQQVVDWLAATDRPPVLLLSGRPGSGRRYLLEAAMHRRRASGGKEQLYSFALDGLGDGSGALMAALDFQVDAANRRRDQVREAVLRELRGALTEAEIDVPGLPWMKLVVALAVPWRLLRALLPGGDPAVLGARWSEEEFLERLLDALCQLGPPVIALPGASPALTDPLRRAFLARARRAQDIRLVFACSDGDSTEAIVGHFDSQRLEVPPLSRGEVRGLLEERFPGLPAALVDRAEARSQGNPGVLAGLMVRLLKEGQIQENRHGQWQIAGPDPQRTLAEAFEKDLLGELDLLRLRTPSRTGELLTRLFEIAPLCGEVFPASVILEHLEATPEDQDEVIDLLDEHLATGTDTALLVDHHMTHPAFCGVLTYSFAEPLTRFLLLQEVERKAPQLARAFLKYLHQGGQPPTRGWAALELELTDSLETDEEREQALLAVGWWVEVENVEALTAKLEEDLGAGRVTPEQLLSLVTRIDEGFPHRRWALLEAIRRSETLLPMTLLFGYHWLRGRVLYLLARYDDALVEAAKAQELSEPGSQKYALALTLVGVTLHDLGNLAAARAAYSDALELREKLLGPADWFVAESLSNLASVHSDLGQHAAARDQIERALEINEARLGPEHYSVGRLLNNLAAVLHRCGELEGARKHHRRALEIREARLGPNHPGVAESLDNLAKVLHDLGEFEAAREQHQRALGIWEARLGPDHPNVAASLEDLGAVLQKLGEETEAMACFERAVRIRENRQGDPKGPS